MPSYVRYTDDVETIAADEPETFQKIIDIMLVGQHKVREKYGQSVRVSHAKAHGFLKGVLAVLPGLPPELAQGLFARPASHPVVARLAQVPGDVSDDRKVSTPRGMAIKVFNVDGPKLTGHEGATTQDFVLDTGKTFIVGGAKAFLQAFQPNARIAPVLSEDVKGLASKAAQATNSVLHAFGMDSGKLDFYGHPQYHPLAEAYYSQAPIRYGDYLAKLSVTPANPELEAMFEKKIDLADENGLRTAVVEYFRTKGATYHVGIQLCTDLEKMPIEDATVEWPEDLSPYRTVATLTFPPQDAYDPARQKVVDYNVTFAPDHSLAAHRPLGSIMRARLAAYPVVSAARHKENGQPVLEPTSIDQIPD